MGSPQPAPLPSHCPPFPTQVRSLFHQKPKGWPIEGGKVDRGLEIAVSQFAPGAQTVKDDSLHTAIGVVEYGPGRFGPQPQPDPLRDRERIFRPLERRRSIWPRALVPSVQNATFVEC